MTYSFIIIPVYSYIYLETSRPSLYTLAYQLPPFPNLGLEYISPSSPSLPSPDRQQQLPNVHINLPTLLNMCSWEQTLYACGDRSSVRRVAYSCEIYTRFVYGECRFDKRRDRVNTVISYDDCNQQNCRLYQFVNLD